MHRLIHLTLALLLGLGGCTGAVDTAAPATGDSAADTHDTGVPGADTGEARDTACTAADTSGDTARDSGADSATTPDSAADTDSGADTGASSTTDSAADSATDSATDTATDTGDSGMPLPSGPVTIYAVRHAEKADDSDDPGLTEEGTARAEALAVLLHDAPLAAIFATELRRTQETVQPTADDHGLTVDTTYDPEEELAAHILSTYGDQEVLTAGHSYTLPDFFEALGLDPVPEVDGYGQLWIITVETDGSATCVESTFGE